MRVLGFGNFTVSKRAASTGRNPQTGEPMQIKASNQAKFKPGKGLKDTLYPEVGESPSGCESPAVRGFLFDTLRSGMTLREFRLKSRGPGG